MSQPKHSDEAGRAAALRRYDVLDTPPEAPFDRIVALVRTVLGVPMAAVSLLDERRQWFKACDGIPLRDMARDIAFAEHTIRGRTPVIVADTSTDRRFAHNPLVSGPPFIGSYAGVPLLSPDGYAIGSLCAFDTIPRTFSADQIAMLAGLAALVVDLLDLRRTAPHDPLTGALSRRALLAEADKAIGRSARYQQPSTLVLFDIDRFAAVNEAQGHAAGDRVLRFVAECCADTIRASDAFGRVGGDSFGILLSDTAAADAMTAAERFRRVIAALPVTAAGSLKITASFGVAEVVHDCATSEAWLERAELGVRNAKRRGRNRCVLVAQPTRTAAA